MSLPPLSHRRDAPSGRPGLRTGTVYEGVLSMPRSPAQLTIANFNRQTLSDLLRPVLERALTQGMVGTEAVLDFVTEALGKISDAEINTFLDPQTGKLRGGLEFRIEETLGLSTKWREWEARHGDESWMLRKSGRSVKKRDYLKSLILSSWRSMQKLHVLEPKDVASLVPGVRKVYDALCKVVPTSNRPGLGNTYNRQRDRRASQR